MANTGSFVGVRNTGIFYEYWLAEQPKAVVVVSHGYSEHSGRYRHVIDALVKANYNVWALDHRGHGRSEGNRAAPDDFEDFVADLAQFIRMVRQHSGKLDIFLLGHSMGGLISALYAYDYQHNLKGLILSGPAFRIGEDSPKALVAISGLVSRLAPNVEIQPFDPSYNSRDPKVVQAFRDDKLNYHGGVKARMAREMLTASQYALANAHKLTIPVLMLQGEQDKLVVPSGGYEAFAAFKSSDKTLKKYPDAFHEVLNEPEQAEIIPFMITWLDQHL